MILTKDTIPHTGSLTWPEPIEAYPDIKPDHPYTIHYNDDLGCFIFIHSGFLGLNASNYNLSHGEIIQDVLSQAIYKP